MAEKNRFSKTQEMIFLDDISLQFNWRSVLNVLFQVVNAKANDQ